MNPTRMTLYSFLIGLSFLGMALAGLVGIRYSYNLTTRIESGVGILILLAIAGLLWLYRNRASPIMASAERNSVILFGLILGLLWVVEIGINNFIAPPLPARDIIDNIFWAAIAVSILVFSTIYAYQKASLLRGVEAGVWSGFVSGLLACLMALLVVVFGMHFILRDPLNIAEWAGRGAGIQTPRMAAYFAFETFAGAYGHLTLLGPVMGGLLGLVGGIIGKVIRAF